MPISSDWGRVQVTTLFVHDLGYLPALNSPSLCTCLPLPGLSKLSRPDVAVGDCHFRKG